MKRFAEKGKTSASIFLVWPPPARRGGCRRGAKHGQDECRYQQNYDFWASVGEGVGDGGSR